MRSKRHCHYSHYFLLIPPFPVVLETEEESGGKDNFPDSEDAHTGAAAAAFVGKTQDAAIIKCQWVKETLSDSYKETDLLPAVQACLTYPHVTRKMSASNNNKGNNNSFPRGVDNSRKEKNRSFPLMYPAYPSFPAMMKIRVVRSHRGRAGSE